MRICEAANLPRNPFLKKSIHDDFAKYVGARFLRGHLTSCCFGVEFFYDAYGTWGCRRHYQPIHGWCG